MTWRIVYASEVNKLSLNLNSLRVVKGDQEVKIPLGDIFALVIEDLTVSVTSRLLIELSNNNILVIFCNQNHLPECMIQPVNGHFKQYYQMKEQLAWDEAFKDNLWMNILRSKIYNQIECMNRMAIEKVRITKMRTLIYDISPKDPKNIEGQASRLYFNSFFADFTRGNDELIENAVLNYGYTIINAAIARTVVAKGLIPSLGVHHIGERNHFNLASDLLEPFRPLVDLFLLIHPPEDGFLTKEYRMELINLMHARVQIDGKMETVIRAIEIMIQSIIEYFRTGDEKSLKFPNIEKYKFYEL